MARDCRITWTRGALAIGLICLIGCQHLGRPGRERKSPWDGGTSTTPISAAQEAGAQIALGRVAEQRGDFEQAKAAYHAAIVRDGSRADAYQRLGVIADKQGKFRESAEQYRQAIKILPGNPEIYCDMGYSFYLQRRWAEAEMNFRQVIAIDPDHQRAHNNLGMVLARNSRTDEAVAEFRKGGCGEAEARENVALARLTEGHRDEARSQYRLALKAQPASKTARARIADIDRLTVKVKAAKRPSSALDPHTMTASVLQTSAPVSAAKLPVAGKRPKTPPRSDVGVQRKTKSLPN